MISVHRLIEWVAWSTNTVILIGIGNWTLIKKPSSKNIRDVLPKMCYSLLLRNLHYSFPRIAIRSLNLHNLFHCIAIRSHDLQNLFPRIAKTCDGDDATKQRWWRDVQSIASSSSLHRSIIIALSQHRTIASSPSHNNPSLLSTFIWLLGIKGGSHLLVNCALILRFSSLFVHRDQ